VTHRPAMFRRMKLREQAARRIWRRLRKIKKTTTRQTARRRVRRREF